MSIKRISAWAILHPVPPVVLFVVLFFIGTIAFVRLPINLSPDISFPLVQVTVSQPGSAPTEIETQILTKIEGAVASVGNVHKLTPGDLVVFHPGMKVRCVATAVSSPPGASSTAASAARGSSRTRIGRRRAG